MRPTMSSNASSSPCIARSTSLRSIPRPSTGRSSWWDRSTRMSSPWATTFNWAGIHAIPRDGRRVRYSDDCTAERHWDRGRGYGPRTGLLSRAWGWTSRLKARPRITLRPCCLVGCASCGTPRRASAPSTPPGPSHGSPRTGLAFACESAAEVDRLYGELTECRLCRATRPMGRVLGATLRHSGGPGWQRGGPLRLAARPRTASRTGAAWLVRKHLWQAEMREEDAAEGR